MVLQGSQDHYSPVHRGTTRPPHDEEFDNEEHYEADILLRYRTLICDRVGSEQEVNPDIKNIRVSPLVNIMGMGIPVGFTRVFSWVQVWVQHPRPVPVS